MCRNVFEKKSIEKTSWLLFFQVACWLLDPDSKEPTLHSIVTSFLPHELPLLDGIETGQGVQSLGLNIGTEHSGRYRACVESILIFNSMNQLNSLLKKENLHGKAKFLAYLCCYKLVIIIYLATFYYRKVNYTFYTNPIVGLSSTGVHKLLCWRPDGKYFWLCRPDSLNHKYSTLPS